MYKLRTTPEDATSPIYKLSVPFFDKGTPEEWIKLWCRLQVVLKGQNVTQGPPSYAVAKTLLKGNASIGLTVKEEVVQVLELNSYLKDFPTHNGNKTQPLDKDELLDILEYRVPASWHREFTVQGFDPSNCGVLRPSRVV
eukprot:2752248-Ditylum_brightwellii.AAC.1